MSRGPAVRQADIDRTLKVLAANGLGVASIVIRAGGEVAITPAPLDQLARTALTPEPAKPQVDDLDTWRERKNARRAAERP